MDSDRQGNGTGTLTMALRHYKALYERTQLKLKMKINGTGVQHPDLLILQLIIRTLLSFSLTKLVFFHGHLIKATGSVHGLFVRCIFRIPLFVRWRQCI